MTNHNHLVVETPKANLVAGMAWLQSAYTIRLNHRHQLVGHGTGSVKEVVKLRRFGHRWMRKMVGRARAAIKSLLAQPQFQERPAPWRASCASNTPARCITS